MNFKTLCFITCIGLVTGLYSCKTEEKKENEVPLATGNNDAERARLIELAFPLNDTIISIDSGNTGGGNAQEFNADSAALRHTPGAEDNTDWYKLTCSGDAGVGFIITPKDPAAELDFVLIRSSGDNFSTELAAGRLNALRSNNNPASGDGSTGLACDAKLRFHGADGGNMSRAFVLRKDQSYYLVINSPKGKSSGYTISFTACAPGADGFFTDFEGDPLNPESEAAMMSDTAGGAYPAGSGDSGNESGIDATGSGNSYGSSGSSGKDGSAGRGGRSGDADGTSGSKAGGNGSSYAKGSGKNGSNKSDAESAGKSGRSGSGKSSGKGSGKNGSYDSNESDAESAGKSGRSGSGKSNSLKSGRSGSGKSVKYVVGEQETLYSIAFKMGMTVEELMELNGLTDTNIYPGQKLKVRPRNLSQKEIDALVAQSKTIKPSPPKPGSTTDPKEIARVKAEKAAAEEARRKAQAEEKRLRAEAAAKSGQDAGKVDPLQPKNTETLSGRNPSFNPTPNFPVNNPKVTQGVETSNSLAPADKSFYVYCNVTSGVNKNPVAGVLQVVDLKKKDLVYNVQANRTQAVPLFNAGGKQKLLICDIFGYKKQDFDLNLDNIINDSTAQQVQIVDDTIVINFELRRLVKGDVAVAYNIFFYDDASVMLPKSTYELDQLLELMQENKKIKVRIHGHTNTSKLGKILYLEQGDKNFFRFTARNKEMFGPAKVLSKKRAETIKMYLESKRITTDRIETEGHGGSQMLYPNTHPLAFKNKRVEVEILEDK